MILLTDEEIVGAEIGAYADKGLPVTDICRYADIENRGVAKAQLKKVGEWGDEECRDPKHDVPANLGHRRECTQCWQELLKEIE